MKNLRSIEIFVRCAELQSLAAGAAATGLTPSAVSKAVSGLEKQLGTRLLARGSRGVSLTDEGERFYSRCRSALAELDAAEREIGEPRERLRGRLRVAVHAGVGRARILPHLPRFLDAYPRLQVEVLLGNGARGLEAEGIDAGVFIGEPEDSGLVARRLAQLEMVTCASPAYVARAGMPSDPQGLRELNCILYIRPGGRLFDEWDFVRGDRQEIVKVSGNVCLNEGSTMTELALAGVGVTRLFRGIQDPMFSAGSLVRLLPDWNEPGPPVYLMYPAAARNSPKVQAFAAFVGGLFQDVRPGPAAASGPPPVRWIMRRST